MLTQVDRGLWIAEGPIVSFFGFAFPTRSVIAVLPDGGLWVWSPVALSAELREAVARLGPVSQLISPNKLHHLSLRAWQQAFPAAETWAPASCIARHRGIAFTGALAGEVAPAGWDGAFEQAHMRGSWAMDEIVFFHRRSRTVIVADLIEAFDDAFLCRHWARWQRPVAALGGIRVENPQAPIDWRLSFWRRGEARAARTRILGWGAERVIMAHGVWQRSGGQAFLERSLAWLGPQ